MYIPFKEGVFMRILSLVLSAALMLGLIFTLSPAAVAEDGVRTIELSSTEKPSGNMPDFDGEMPDFDGELPEGFEENFGGGNRPEGDFFGGGSTTATCTATKEFELSEVVNAFSGVSDIRHSPVEQNGVTVCSVCGITVTDDDSLTETESDSDGNNTLIYIFVALGSAAVTSGITLAVIFIIRKKKSAPETTEE